MFKYLIKHYLPFVPAVAAVICLAGCSIGGSKFSKKPVEIVVWHYYNGAQKIAFDRAVKNFNETLGYEKGIIVEAAGHGGVNELAADVLAAARGELDAGNMPDIFEAYGDAALEILNMGMAAEIDNYLTEKDLGEYEESFIREGRLGTDKLYVFPIAKSTESLMLNKTDFDAFAAGLKASGLNETVSYDDLSTFEGILRVSDIYYRYTDLLTPETKNDGKAFAGIDSLANYIIVGSKQLGQDIVKVEAGNVTVNLDTEIMSKLWYTYYKPMVTGRFVKLGRFCSDDIKTGDSLCFIGSNASASYFPSEIMPDDGEIRYVEMMVLPMPIFENGDKVAASQGAGMVIVKSDKEKEYASALFLKWFTESEQNVSFSLSSSYMPVKKESLDERILNAAFEAADSGDATVQNSIKSLKVGIEQLKGYTLYSSDVFDGCADFRDKLPLALAGAVREDKALYVELLRDGVHPDQAYSMLSEQSHAKFEGWLNSLYSVN